jgi:hypothetical protein
LTSKAEFDPEETLAAKCTTLWAMTHDQQALNVLSTWTDQLNHALHPLDILLSGEDAISIFPELARGSPHEVLRSITDTDFARIAEAANRYCETDKINASHIRKAVERTNWHWQDT